MVVYYTFDGPLTFPSTNRISRLQREQPVCWFKAKTLISLRMNETTQRTTFSIDTTKMFDIKANLYNVFHNSITRFLNFSYISSNPT